VIADKVQELRQAHVLGVNHRAVDLLEPHVGFGARKQAREEARYAVERARHSGPKIAGLLSGSKADVWFEQIDGTVVYAENVGLPKFLDFIRDHVLKPGDEIRYGEILDRLRDLVTQEENSLLQTDGDE
jgi:hypothetical protein